MRYIVYFFALIQFVQAQTIQVKGRILDQSNRSIPYANVYIKNSSIGVISNSEGEYTIKTKPGTYTLVFKQIGYKVEFVTIQMIQDTVLNVSLNEEKFELKEVVVNAEVNPAIEIIKKAQAKRAYYKQETNAFSCDVYIKGIQKVKKAPKRIMGLKVSMPTLLDSASGIIYLSESVSKFYFQQKDKIREDMVASKVSGSNNAFSFNRASDMYFNFYENLIQVNQLVPRGLISPISNNSFFTYKYKYKGSIIDQNILVHKIELVPKIKSDPAFRGTIYIQDSTWRIHAMDVFLTKDAGIAFVDTLKIQQSFLPVNASAWLPFTNVFSFSFKFLGIVGNGQYTSTNSSYNLLDQFPDTIFSAQQFKVSKASLNKDSAFWNLYRPTPLNLEERKDYKLKDSVMRIRRSKPYLDSTDKKDNKFRLINLIAGYGHKNTFKRQSWSIKSPLQSVSYNTVQGWNIDLNYKYTKRDSLRRFKTLDINTQYGFANERFGVKSKFHHFFDVKHLSSFTVSAGRYFTQYNTDMPIGNLNNALHTLFLKQNEMKLFQKDELSFVFNSEWVNALYYTLNAAYESRAFVENKSFAFYGNKDLNQAFTKNLLSEIDPNNPELYSNNAILKFSFGLKWRIGQKFELREERKIVLEQKWPEVEIEFFQATPFNKSSRTQFTRFDLTFRDKLNFKVIGSTDVLLKGQYFVAQKDLRATDYIHIQGNQTIITDFDLAQLQLVPYYKYSSNAYTTTFALQHNFGGFILNKVPLLNRLHLEEHFSFKALNNDRQKLYTEYAFGISKLVFRVDGILGYDFEKKNQLYGLRMAIDL